MTKFRLYGLSILIAFLVSIYVMTSAGKFHIIDEVSLFAVTESLALRGEVDTNAIAWTQWVNSPGEVLGAFGEDGQVYSKKGPAPAFAAVPWYLALRAFGLLDFTTGLLQSTLLWNGIVTALTAALLWLTAVRLGYNDRTGAALGLLFGLTTIAWPYANHFFGEPLSAFSLLLAFYGILSWLRTKSIGWMVLAGSGAAIAIATVTAHTLLVGVLGLYALAGWWFLNNDTPTEDDPPSANDDTKHAVRSTQHLFTGLIAFAIPLLIGGSLLLGYNLIRFGNPFDTGYHFDSGEGFTTPIGQGFWGLVASPYRGVFWHTPLFFATIFAFLPFFRRHRLEALIIGTLSLVLIGLYSMWWMWWGGFAWGPRFLVPLTPFWVLPLGPWVENAIIVPPSATPHRKRTTVFSAWIRSLGASGIALGLLALTSLIVQISAVTVNYVNYEIELRGLFPTDWADPLAFGPPAQSIMDMQYSPVIGQFKLMLAGFVINTDLAWLWASGNVQWLVVLVGGAVLLTLTVGLVSWWLAAGPTNKENQVPGWPVRLLVLILPLILIAVWSGEVTRNPHYGDPGQGYRAVLEEICTSATENDAIVSIAPYAYHVPMNWMATHCDLGLPIYGYAKNSFDQPEAQQVLNEVELESDRIWFVTAGLPVSDPENTIERWLADTAYKADDDWHGDYRLVRYGTPQSLEDEQAIALNLPMRGARGMTVTVLNTRSPDMVVAGEIMPVDIFYELATEINVDLRWFVQLISPEGYVTAQLDTGPIDGYAQFTGLEVGKEQLERAGLEIPANAKDGVYQLIAGLYDPNAEGAPRFIAPDGSDFVELGKVTVEAKE